MGADLLWTQEQAAEHLHVSTKTLRQLRQRGLIRYVAVTERKILYRPEDCAAFVESRARQEEFNDLSPPRPRRRTGRAKAGNVISFTERRKQRLGERA